MLGKRPGRQFPAAVRFSMFAGGRFACLRLQTAHIPVSIQGRIHMKQSAAKTLGVAALGAAFAAAAAGAANAAPGAPGRRHRRWTPSPASRPSRRL